MGQRAHRGQRGAPVPPTGTNQRQGVPREIFLDDYETRVKASDVVDVRGVFAPPSEAPECVINDVGAHRASGQWHYVLGAAIPSLPPTKYGVNVHITCFRCQSKTVTKLPEPFDVMANVTCGRQGCGRSMLITHVWVPTAPA
jgi:hypothetical protein